MEAQKQDELLNSVTESDSTSNFATENESFDCDNDDSSSGKTQDESLSKARSESSQSEEKHDGQDQDSTTSGSIVYDWDKDDFTNETNDIKAFQPGFNKPRKVKEVKTEAEDNWEWLKYWYNSKPKEDILTDEDVVSEDESNRRIFIMFLALALSLIVGDISLMALLSQSKHQPVMRMPIISDPDIFLRQFPLHHVALVLKNGTVLDVSMFEKVSPSKNVLFHLPKPLKYSENYAPYHGYSDSKGILYFIDGRASRLITKFHPKLDKEGHETVPKSSYFFPEQTLTLYQSLMMSNRFWLLFGSALFEATGGLFDEHNTWPETLIWHTRKQVWTKGPELSTANLDFVSMAAFEPCIAALNESHAVLTGLNGLWTPTIHDRIVAIVNMKMNTWYFGPTLPITGDDYLPYSGCRSTLSYSSKENLLIFIHLQHTSHNSEQIRHVILSIDASDESLLEWNWTIINDLFTYSNTSFKIIHLMDVKGTLHSFFENGVIWKHTKHGLEEESMIKGQRHQEDGIVGLIPYLA